MKLSVNDQIWCLQIYLLIYQFYCILSGYALKIRPKVCSNALGEEGTCMFVWECIKTEGKHLGTCVDGFLFGSCCGHNDSDNSIESNAITTAKPYTYNTTSATNIHSIHPLHPLHPIHPIQPIQSPTSASTSVSTIASTSVSTFVSTSAVTVTASPIHSPSQPQVWPIQSNPNPNPIHTFRPPIFSLFSTFRPPPGSNIFMRPTFRPPIVMKPTSIYQQIYNTRSTTITPINKTTITTTSSSSNPSNVQTSLTSVTTPSTTLIKVTTTQVPSSSNTVSEIYTKKPIVSSRAHCGIPQLLPQTKVVGGKNSAFGSWPWQVSVRRTSFFGFSSTHRCGGAILNNQWIATAGHCVDDLLLTQIRIRLGEYDFSSVLEPYAHIERGAKKKVVHPHYNFFTYENDLALVQLDDPIEFQPHVAPICLPPDHIELLGRNGTVTGWGRLSEGGVLPSVLQEVRVPIVSNDKCKNMFLTAGRHEYIPEIFMCAGYDEGGRDSCQGDSGGPLQVQGDDGKWFLAGIISWGIGCGEPSLPGVCTRISKFKQWILNNIS